MRTTRSVCPPGRLVVMMIGLLHIAGCSPQLAVLPAASSVSPGAAHVHALAVDPAIEDGLFIATHGGLLRYADGAVERVGDRFHDLMGFTAAESGELVASGHPDLRSEELLVDGRPPLLGLVESDDGVRWQPQSLLGEVDFHVIELAHDQIYGWDSTSGTLQVSADGRAWDVRSTIDVHDLAVSPDDPDVLLAAGSGPLLRSTDGGREWSAISPAPALTLIEWDDQGAVGAGPDGSLFRSADGLEWARSADGIGVPEALEVAGDVVYLAVEGQGIHRSLDRGGTTELFIRAGG